MTIDSTSPRRHPHRRTSLHRVILMLTALLVVGVLPALASPSYAGPGDEQTYRNPDDGHDHTCRQADAAGTVADDDRNGGEDVTGDVNINAAAHYIEINQLRPTGVRIHADSNEDVAIGNYVPALGAPWVRYETIISRFSSGFSYVRYGNPNTGELRYYIQITRAGVTGPTRRPVYSSFSMSAYQRDRMNAFREAVLGLRDQEANAGIAGSVGVAIFGLGIGAVQHEGSDAAGPIGVCSAVVAGLIYIGARWVSWLSSRRNAIAAWDEMGAPAS